MKFKILTLADKGEWTNLISKLKPTDQDIHFLPEYGEIYKKTYGFEPFLAFYGDREEFVVQPFIKRELNQLPFLSHRELKQNFFDIANPYGYGGPVLSAAAVGSNGIYRNFDNAFYDYCQTEKIASEFTSLHPFLENHEITDGSETIKAHQEKEVVYIDLTKSEEEIYTDFSRGHKSGVNKAKRSGVVIKKAEANPANIKLFNQLYYHTMSRNQAAQRWFFPEDYFANCHKFLGERRVSLFFAMVDGKLASAYLLMHDFRYCYYHFGASSEDFFDLRPNNLLMYETALWAKREGYERYHLGGGVSKEDTDPLFRFKSGFSKERATLYTYCRIHHLPTYELLCKLKRQEEIESTGQEIESDYFPLYRR